MIIYFTLLFAVFLVAYLTEKRKGAAGFFLFLILGTFSAVRDGIGVDYGGYLLHIERIVTGKLDYMEIGFQYLTKFLYAYTGSIPMVIGLCGYITCFFFLLAIYHQSKDKKMSIFLFLSWGYYFLTFNTVRNYLALAIAVYAIEFLIKRKNMKFLAMIIVAVSIHKTALVCLPVYYLANRKYRKEIYLLIVGIGPVLLLAKPWIRRMVFSIYAVYENGAYDTGDISWFNIGKALIVVILGLIYYKKIENDSRLNFYFNLNVVSFMLYTFVYWIPEISRIGFYFNISSIFFLPNLVEILNEKNKKVIQIFVYTTGIIIFFLLMLQFSSETIQLLPYKTWLF